MRCDYHWARQGCLVEPKKCKFVVDIKDKDLEEDGFNG
jgi:hypothetical protein